MGFHEDAIFPSKLAAGSRFGLRHDTAVVSNPSAYSQRVPRLDLPLIIADVSTALTSPAGATELLRFFTARQGATYGFRFPHPFDRSSNLDDRSDATTPNDQRIGVGNGIKQRFKLRKAVVDGGIARYRNILKPIVGSVTVAINGTQVTAFDVDHTNGEILFNQPPQQDDVITAGFLYDIPMRFEEEVEDSMFITHQPHENALLPQVGLVEERFGDPTHGEYFFGGSYVNEAMVTIESLSVLQGRVVDLDPQNTDLVAQLPDFTDLPTGGPYFYVNNRSGIFPFSLEDANGVELAFIQPAQTVQVVLVEGSTGKRWVAF